MRIGPFHIVYHRAKFKSPVCHWVTIGFGSSMLKIGVITYKWWRMTKKLKKNMSKEYDTKRAN